MNFIQSILPAIEHFHMAGYWLALLAAFFETTIGVGLLIPGSFIVLLMGSLAAQNYFDLGDLIWFAAIGAILGDNINYYIGKKFGTKIFANGFWFIKSKHIKKGEEFFKSSWFQKHFYWTFYSVFKRNNATGCWNFWYEKTVIYDLEYFGCY